MTWVILSLFEQQEYYDKWVEPPAKMPAKWVKILMHLRPRASFVCLIGLLSQCQIVLGQSGPIGYKPDKVLVSAVRNAKVIKADFPVHVLKNGAEVMVTTLANPGASEKSMKIDAVLVAKAIMDSDKKILIVRYRVKDDMRDPDCLAVVVKQSDVMAYGVNAINADNLLAELKVTKRSGRRPRP